MVLARVSKDALWTDSPPFFHLSRTLSAVYLSSSKETSYGPILPRYLSVFFSTCWSWWYFSIWTKIFSRFFSDGFFPAFDRFIFGIASSTTACCLWIFWYISLNVRMPRIGLAFLLPSSVIRHSASCSSIWLRWATGSASSGILLCQITMGSCWRFKRLTKNCRMWSSLFLIRSRISWTE